MGRFILAMVNPIKVQQNKRIRMKKITTSQDKRLIKYPKGQGRNMKMNSKGPSSKEPNSDFTFRPLPKFWWKPPVSEMARSGEGASRRA